MDKHRNKQILDKRERQWARWVILKLDDDDDVDDDDDDDDDDDHVIDRIKGGKAARPLSWMGIAAIGYFIAETLYTSVVETLYTYCNIHYTLCTIHYIAETLYTSVAHNIWAAS